MQMLLAPNHGKKRAAEGDAVASHKKLKPAYPYYFFVESVVIDEKATLGVWRSPTPPDIDPRSVVQWQSGNGAWVVVDAQHFQLNIFSTEVWPARIQAAVRTSQSVLPEPLIRLIESYTDWIDVMQLDLALHSSAFSALANVQDVSGHSETTVKCIACAETSRTSSSCATNVVKGVRVRDVRDARPIRFMGQ